MSEDNYEARLLAGQVLLVPGVRKGILRKPGILILTRSRLLFLPETGKCGEAGQRLAGCEDDTFVSDALDAAIAATEDDDHGMCLKRGQPGLGPPDDEGRLRLLALGEEDDLLIPPPAVGLVRLVMGPRVTAPHAAGAPTPQALAFQTPVAGAPPSLFAPTEGSAEIPGWTGPISGGVGALLALVGLPLLVLASVMLVEEVDDELGAVVFLLGAAVLALSHLGTFVGAGFGFARREVTRLWGLGTLAFAGLTGLILMAGCLIALEELF